MTPREFKTIKTYDMSTLILSILADMGGSDDKFGTLVAWIQAIQTKSFDLGFEEGKLSVQYKTEEDRLKDLYHDVVVSAARGPNPQEADDVGGWAIEKYRKLFMGEKGGN